jgi:hypothetical protein
VMGYSEEPCGVGTSSQCIHKGRCPVDWECSDFSLRDKE